MKIDLTGMRFNHLSVIRKSDKQSNRAAYWECLCDCGNKTIVSTYALRGGHTKSCGCLKHRSNVLALSLNQGYGSGCRDNGTPRSQCSRKGRGEKGYGIIQRYCLGAALQRAYGSARGLDRVREPACSLDGIH